MNIDDINSPSSYTMQIFVPSLFQAISVTTDLFLLFIISSNQEANKNGKAIVKVIHLIRRISQERKRLRAKLYKSS